MDVMALWVYLSTSPLLWLTATLGAYAIAERISRALNRNPLANPVLIAVVLLVALLAGSGTPFPVYFEGAQFVHFMLGPATVALAVPLVQNFAEVRRNLLPMLAALVARRGNRRGQRRRRCLGAGRRCHADRLAGAQIRHNADRHGHIGKDRRLPAVTAVLVILTGVIGAVIVTPVMNMAGIRDWAARGFAAGVSAHGIGTARAFLVNPVAGTFAGIGMGMNGIVTAIILAAALALLQ